MTANTLCGRMCACVETACIFGVIVLTLATLPRPVYGQRVLVEWNFPDETANEVSDGGTVANSNRTISAQGGVGTVLFTVSGVTTRSARALGWQDGALSKYWMVAFNSAGYEALTVCSRQLSSDSGPAHFKVQYRIDGDPEWGDVAGGTVVSANNWSSGVLSELALPMACSDQALVFLRWLMTDDVSVTNGTVVSSGASRIDDIRVRGTRLVVPPPQVLGATEIGAAGFTANWLPVEDATGYELDVAVTAGFAAGIPDPHQTLVVDFEGVGETKGSYVSGVVNLSGIDWALTDVLIGTSSLDWKEGARSARLRGYGHSAMTMQADLANGLGAISFFYRRYGTDSQADWRVEYSTDGGTNWVQIGADFTAPAADDVQVFSNVPSVAGSVRVRIKRGTEEGATNRRLNIDHMVLEPYEAGDFVPGYQSRPVNALLEPVTGLSRGTYYYRVRAVDGDVVGAYSGVMRVRASDTPPGFLMFSR